MADILSLLAQPLASQRGDFSGIERGISSLKQSLNNKKLMERQERIDADTAATNKLRRESIQQQIDREKAAIEKSGKIEALKDYGRDLETIRFAFDNGAPEQAPVLLAERISRLQSENIDAQDTTDLLNLYKQSPQAFRARIGGELAGLARTEIIGADPSSRAAASTSSYAPVPLVSRDENGEITDRILVIPTFNKQTGEASLEPADIPPGYEIFIETPEEERQAKLQAKLDEVQGRLDAELGTKPQIAADTKQAEAAVKKADDLFETVGAINVNISNLRQAKQAVIDGAGTGPIEQLWPSFRAESVRLDNLQGRLGLDIVGATTFGALSKGELDLSKQVALPTGLDGPELVKWLDDRIAAQEAKQEYLQRQAIFLSEKNPATGKQNTKADWAKAEEAALREAIEAAGATEEDIKETMRANDMDRSAVLAEIRRRYERGRP